MNFIRGVLERAHGQFVLLMIGLSLIALGLGLAVAVVARRARDE